MLSAGFMRELAKVCEDNSIGKLCGCSDELVASYIYDNLDALQKINRAIRANAAIDRKVDDGHKS